MMRDKQKTTAQDYLVLGAMIFLLLAVGGGIGAVTAPDQDSWYNGLVKSTLTPPGWVFGVVWPLLYLMIATSAWTLWRAGVAANSTVGRLFIIQLFLNWGWSFVFFTAHAVGVALVWMVILGVCVGVLIHRVRFIRLVAALLLVPYMAWLCFATYLTAVIWVMN